MSDPLSNPHPDQIRPAPPLLIGSYLEAESFFKSPYYHDSYYFPFNPDPLARGNNYKIYDEMLDDDQIKVALSFKKDIVVNAGWQIVCERPDVQDFVTVALQRLQEDGALQMSFEDVLRDMLSAYGYGFSLAEPVFKINTNNVYVYDSIRVRPPQSFRFQVDDYGTVTEIIQMSNRGELHFDPRLFCHHAYQQEYGNPYGKSDLRAAYKSWTAKKFITKFLAIYLERFGSPTVVGKYPATWDTDEVAKFHSMLKSIQQTTALAVPESSIIDFVMANKDSSDMYIKALDYYNMHMARSLLVPDLLGISGEKTRGGSFALGQDQFKMFLATIEKDRQSLARKITLRIISPLVAANFGPGIKCDFSFTPYTMDDNVELMKVWAQLAAGQVFKPNPEEINHLRKQIKFPEGDVLEVNVAPPVAQPLQPPTDTYSQKDFGGPGSGRRPGNSPKAERIIRANKIEKHIAISGRQVICEVSSTINLGNMQSGTDINATIPKGQVILSQNGDGDLNVSNAQTGYTIINIHAGANYDEYRTLLESPSLIPKNVVYGTGLTKKFSEAIEFKVKNRPTVRRTQFAGLPVNVEIEPGQTKSGVDDQGRAWSNTYMVPYGEIPKTTGNDGDPVDCYIGPNPNAPNVYVVHQMNSKGKFDEDKVFLGFDSPHEAEQCYRDHGPQDGFGSMDVMTLQEFKNGYLASNREFRHKMFAKLKRDVTQAERKVNFTQIQKSMDDSESSLSRTLKRAATQIWKDYCKQIKDSNLIARFDPQRLTELKPRFLKDMNIVLRNGYRDLLEQAYAEAHKELFPTAKFGLDEGELEYEDMMKVLDSESFNTVADYSGLVNKKVNSIIAQGLKQGLSTSDIMDLISNELPDATDTWINTLVRTKTTEIYNRGRKSYFDNDPDAQKVIDGYQFSAILDARTTDICRGLDKKVFKSGDDNINLLTPPLHFNCRSVIVPVTIYEQDVMDDAEEVPDRNELQDMGAGLLTLKAEVKTIGGENVTSK